MTKKKRKLIRGRSTAKSGRYSWCKPQAKSGEDLLSHQACSTGEGRGKSGQDSGRKRRRRSHLCSGGGRGIKAKEPGDTNNLDQPQRENRAYHTVNI